MNQRTNRNGAEANSGQRTERESGGAGTKRTAEPGPVADCGAVRWSVRSAVSCQLSAVCLVFLLRFLNDNTADNDGDAQQHDTEHVPAHHTTPHHTTPHHTTPHH